MTIENGCSRRRFVGGLTAALGYWGLQPQTALWAQSGGDDPIAQSRVPPNDYDGVAKLCFNENPYGPPESVMKAMTQALKYANRYGYPEGGVVEAIAALHGSRVENVMLGAGSTEILHAVADTFLVGQKKVLGVEPTFGSVYAFATGLKAKSRSCSYAAPRSR